MLFIGKKIVKWQKYGANVHGTSCAWNKSIYDSTNIYAAETIT
jgi:hypothetical protein